MQFAKRISLAAVCLFVWTSCASNPGAAPHVPNRSPLKPGKYIELPVGAVKPEGWLKDQLIIQATGLTGHLEEFWPSVWHDSGWRGGPGEAWERGPYYLDGLVPLAYLLEDERLIKKIKPYIEFMLNSGQGDGWFGPKKNRDRWPVAVAMKVLTQYQEATGDPRVIPLLQRYFGYLKNNKPDWPDKEWRGVRAMENVVTAYWLYNRTGDPSILDVAKSIYDNSYDWTRFFERFPYTKPEKPPQLCHQSHVVNLAMAVKHPGVYYQQSHEERHREAVYKGLKSLDEFHGQAAGRFSGDEHLNGTRPTSGTELCAVVEFMFSLEHLMRALEDTAFADRLEVLAYNALPGAFTPNFWHHQYDQQSNQVQCTKAKRPWDNSDTANLYGLAPHYGCCTANLHQGWPKFVSHMWMATVDRGLVAMAYGPSRVTANLAGGVDVTIEEETEYPFDGEIVFTVRSTRSAKFPVTLRIPGWAEGATVQAKDVEHKPGAGSFFRLEDLWKNGDRIVLNLPMNIRTETRFNGAVSILRGPLYFSLKMGERYQQLYERKDTAFPHITFEVYPMTPWNYALDLDRENPGSSVHVVRKAVSTLPWAQSTAPITLKVKGRQVPDWKIVDNSAGDPPASPVTSSEPVKEVELIPYGSTRLRITEFPTLKK